jgi:hypothetical protein
MMARYHGLPPGNSKPVLWYRLIKEVEEFNAESKMGMANVWIHIHNEDYDRARKLFDRIQARYRARVA